MNSKNSILLFIFLILFVTSTKAQTKDESIGLIRKIFQQTNSEKDLTRIQLENDELTDEVPDGGVSLTGYFKDQVLLKISLWIGLSYGISEVEYYFNKDSLLFAYVTEKHFRNTADTINYSKADIKFEGRYYYKNGKLIYKTTKGNGFWNSSTDSEESLPADANNYLRILYIKKNKSG